MDTINMNEAALQDKLSFETFRNAVLSDFQICLMSRETSLLGRREVLTGKAKFGIFGDGVEVAQVAMAKVDITVIKPSCLQQVWQLLNNFFLSYMQILMQKTIPLVQAGK